MNPTSPALFTCDESRVLDRLILDADAHGARAQKWIADRAAARTAKATAEKEFLLSLDPEDARNLAATKVEESKYSTVVAVIENAGGPAVLRENALRTNQTFSLLAQGFARRVEALDARLLAARKVLSTLRAERTEAGVANVEADPVVIAAHATVINLGVQRNAADAGQQYCYRWNPSVAHRPFSEIYGSLVAPLV